MPIEIQYWDLERGTVNTTVAILSKDVVIQCQKDYSNYI